MTPRSVKPFSIQAVGRLISGIRLASPEPSPPTTEGWSNPFTALDSDKVELLELALSRLPHDHPDRAILLATWCSDVAFTTHHDDRLPFAEESIALAEATGDDTTIVRIHNQVALFVPFAAVLGAVAVPVGGRPGAGETYRRSGAPVRGIRH